MTRAQQIIKYAAIAFALFLAVSIIAGIVGAVGIIAGLTTGGESAIGEETTLTVDETVTRLDIELGAAELIVRTGPAFSVTENSEYITCKVQGGALKIEERSHGWKVNSEAATVVVELPQGQVFETVEIVAGAGKVTIEDLVTSRETDIEGGAGAIDIRNSEFTDLDLVLGVGKVRLEAAILGDSSIEFGVGEADVTLLGSATDYSVRMDKGIGSATLDGVEMKSGEKYGNGSHRVEMDGGVGAVKLRFSE